MSERGLLSHPDIWRANQRLDAGHGVPTGYPALDALLPGGGWPTGALTEILTAQEGIRALSLVMPALARLSRTGRWVVWVSPPHIPYAPALAAEGMDLGRLLWVHAQVVRDSLWTLEQALRSGTCGAVVAWVHQADHKSLRRLQLAAEAGHTWGVLFRPSEAVHGPSPASLRLRLDPGRNGLGVHILKRRGGFAAGPLYLETSHALAMHTSATALAGSLLPG